jgi:excisionase family DNA binding protein
MLSLEQIWEILDKLPGEKKEEIFNSILKLISKIDGPKAEELYEDMIAFKDEMLSKEVDPLKEMMTDTYTKKEASEIFSVSQKTIQRMISRGLLKPVNPGRKPLRFNFNDLKEVFVGNIEEKHDFLDYSVLKFSSAFCSESKDLSKSKRVDFGKFTSLDISNCNDETYMNQDVQHSNKYALGGAF